MLELADDNEVIRIRAAGRLEGQDYHRFVPKFERIAAREPGTVPMVIELAPGFAGWDLGGLWRDLKFDAKHKDSFGRIAIVGDGKWEEWDTKLLNPLFKGEMRFFQPPELRHAEEWALTGRGTT